MICIYLPLIPSLRLNLTGVGNPKPKFLISSTTVKSFRAVGKTQKHLQFQVNVGNTNLDGIAFNMAYLNEQYKIGETADLAVELLADTWNGQKKLKLRLVDIRKAN